MATHGVKDAIHNNDRQRSPRVQNLKSKEGKKKELTRRGPCGKKWGGKRTGYRGGPIKEGRRREGRYTQGRNESERRIEEREMEGSEERRAKNG